VQNYIDVILIGAVVVTLIPTIWHYIQSSRKAKHEMAAGPDGRTDAEEASHLVLNQDTFEKKHERP
jgi:membrane-associated protein